ncbi:Hypothetical protein NocV09_00800420 [Nannochloropsis oceanica]
MSSSGGGFTEDDQARLYNQTVSHAVAKGSKRGLGFCSGPTSPPLPPTRLSSPRRKEAKLRETARQTLERTSRMDTELKVANQKGHGWEGQDMHATAEFLQEEEALATGAEGALERQEARRKMIAAIEDEGIESLSQHTKVGQEWKAKEALARGRAAKKARNAARRARRSQREENALLPLYKSLKKGDKVEAKWGKDNLWYPGLIKACMHSGYPIMKAEVVFDGWGNIDEVSWQDIRLLQAGSEDEDSEEESESEGETEGGQEGGEEEQRPVVGRPRAVWETSSEKEDGKGMMLMDREKKWARKEEEEKERLAKLCKEKEEEEDDEEQGLLSPVLLQAKAPCASVVAAASGMGGGGGAGGAAAAAGGGWKARAAAARDAVKRKQQAAAAAATAATPAAAAITVTPTPPASAPVAATAAASGMSVAAFASKLALKVEEEKVSMFLQDQERPRLCMSWGGGEGKGKKK